MQLQTQILRKIRLRIIFKSNFHFWLYDELSTWEITNTLLRTKWSKNLTQAYDQNFPISNHDAKEEQLDQYKI